MSEPIDSPLPPAPVGEAPRKVSHADRRVSFIAEVQKQHGQKIEEKPFVAKNLTTAQQDKLTALFEKYFDVDKDGVFTQRDVDSLNEKIIDFTGWTPQNNKVQKILEYHLDLYKCLLMEINKDMLLDEHKATSITLNAWLKMWDHLMHRTLALDHLPQWVQVLPYSLFTFIDKKEEGIINKQHLLEFYTDFMLLDEKRAKTVCDRAWTQMTGNGDFKLTLDLYTMCFANFLFGKSYYGPGLYLLGTFPQCTQTAPFKFVAPSEMEKEA